MSDQPVQLEGKKPGQTSVVLVGVHGNEKCGPRALEALLPTLTIDRGTVWFLCGNPRACEKRVRFTEENLNRMFNDERTLSQSQKKSYEYDRAQYLKYYFDQADVLLDVHASFTPHSVPFAICEPNVRGIVEYLPVDRVVSGFDAVQPGGTDYYMNRSGKVGICIECGYLDDPVSTQRAIDAITAFLSARGHRKDRVATRQQTHTRMNIQYLTTSDRFRLSRYFFDFEELEAGTVIGRDGDQPIVAQKNGVILFARDRDQIGDEAFLFGEKISGSANEA